MVLVNQVHQADHMVKRYLYRLPFACSACLVGLMLLLHGW